MSKLYPAAIFKLSAGLKDIDQYLIEEVVGDNVFIDSIPISSKFHF